jgi:hypothetical protein
LIEDALKKKKLEISGSPCPLYTYKSLYPLFNSTQLSTCLITGTLREHRAKNGSSASFEATSCLLSLRCDGNSGEVAPRISPAPGSMTRIMKGCGKQQYYVARRLTQWQTGRRIAPKISTLDERSRPPSQAAPLQPRPQSHKRMPRRDSFLKGSRGPRPAYRESHRTHQEHQEHQEHQGAAGFS